MTGHTEQGAWRLRATRGRSLLRAIGVGVCILSVGVLIGTMLISTGSTIEEGNSGLSSRHKRAEDVIVNRTPSPNGAIYTRWGRSVCPEGATLLYKGVMASGHKDHVGGTPAYLCLTNSPQTANTTGSYGHLYGVEFSTGANAVCSKANAPAGLTNEDAVCAVCRSRRVGQLMIPGCMTCLPGWTMEYFGYLMGSEIKEKTQRDIVCVDHAPDAADKGARSDVGSYLWPAQPVCGAIPCPKYTANAELTCVLCTQ